MRRVDTRCLVVGAGPVGMTAAKLLRTQGVDHLVVERRHGPQPLPAAHVVNARTLEIWRQAGFDMEAIDAVAKAPADAGHVNFVTRLGGELIGRLPFERQGAEVSALTPTPLRNISQHRVEPLLAASLRDAGTEIRYGTVWESSGQTDDGVVSVVRDLDGDERVEVHSGYVIAADGASSRVRASLDIEMEGPASLQHFVAIHVYTSLRPLVGDRPGVLHFVLDPAVAGGFVAHDLDRESVFMVGYDPGTESVDDYDVERCESIVRAAIGPGGVDHPLEIAGVGVWNMSAQVAASMCHGRIVLAGDAAHRFPPTGGLGLNTGVADAHAIAWRIAAIEAGWADAALLTSYESERRPVAVVNCEQSTTNAMKMVLLADALGLLESPTTERLAASLADPARRPAIDAAVGAQATHFDMLGLQLGYRYEHGALCADRDRPPADPDPRRFEPTASVGERLPHGWLADGRSTLDLVDPSSLTLLSTGDHDRWSVAARRTCAPVRHLGVGVDVRPDERWSPTCRLEPGEALLVRPDQHVCWRGNRPDELAAAVETVLGSGRTAG